MSGIKDSLGLENVGIIKRNLEDNIQRKTSSKIHNLEIQNEIKNAVQQTLGKGQTPLFCAQIYNIITLLTALP